MSRSHRSLALLALLLALAGRGAVDGAATAPGAGRYFAETGHTVGGRFLDYWESHGGLAQQGYPLTDEIQEVSDTDGKIYTVQYFERAVFEAHPENPAPYDVLLSLLGVFEYRQREGSAGALNQHPSTDNPRFFPQTGHTLGDVFRTYWESHGGLAQQGYPISDEFTEVSDLDGKSYTVQYFQRAVFELHPENAGTPYEVLLSQLGTFRYQTKHADLAIPTLGPDGQQFDPQGSDSYLVWVDRMRTYRNVILGLDLRTNQMVTVTDAPRVQLAPAISGSKVVWEDHGTGCPPDCSTRLIRGTDLATGQVFSVGDARNVPSFPAINGSTVAWVEFSDAERLLTKDLASDTPQVLATLPLTNGMSFGPLFNRPAAISDEYIVWAIVGPSDMDRVRDSSVQLQAYDLATGTTRTIAQYHEPNWAIPQYSLDGHRLVWFDGVWELRYADLRTGETALLWNDVHLGAPFIRGDVVLWSGLGPTCCSGGSIYGLHLEDRQPHILVSGVGQDVLLTVAGDWLVWQSTGPQGVDPLHATRLTTAFAVAPPAPPTPTAGPAYTPAPAPTVGPTETPPVTETPAP